MKITSTSIPKTFEPIRVIIDIEAPVEANAIKRALTWYLDNATHNPYKKIIEELIPAFTLL